MPIRVDLRSKTPAYLQIVEQIRALAADGILKPGDQLPTIRRTAEAARIHFNTVARAYRVLDEAGIISTQHGRGSYMVGPWAARLPRRAELKRLSREYVAAAERLGFSGPEMRNALERALGRRRPEGKKNHR